MTQPALHIESFTLGDWMTNCYVLHTPSRATWLIDAGFNPEPMLSYLQDNDLRPERVVLTHAHVDHIAGLGQVRAAYPELPIAIHAAERAFLGDAALNLSIALSEPVIAPQADELLEHGQSLELDGLSWQVLHTPGHSPGGISLYCAQQAVVLSGDALFAGSIGRHDLPGSDGRLLLSSIREQLLSLPNDTRVLCGHGPETTIGRERTGNPFLAGQ